MTLALTENEAAAWRALVLLWRKGFPAIDRTFRRHGMLHFDYTVLDLLANDPSGVMNAGMLGELSGVTSSRLSHRLDVMEERGDVTRRAGTSDRRVVEVVLTPSGLGRRGVVEGEHLADVRSLVFDALSTAETAALANALGSITAGFAVPPPPAPSETDPDLTRPDAPSIAERPGVISERVMVQATRLAATFDPLLD